MHCFVYQQRTVIYWCEFQLKTGETIHFNQNIVCTPHYALSSLAFKMLPHRSTIRNPSDNKRTNEQLTKLAIARRIQTELLQMTASSFHSTSLTILNTEYGILRSPRLHT